MNSFSFCMSLKVFILPSVWQKLSLGIEFPVERFFFQYFKDVTLLFFLVLFLTRSLLSFLCMFLFSSKFLKNIFCLLLILNNFSTVCLYVAFCMLSSLGLLDFLDLLVYSDYQKWNKLLKRYGLMGTVSLNLCVDTQIWSLPPSLPPFFYCLISYSLKAIVLYILCIF